MAILLSSSSPNSMLGSDWVYSMCSALQCAGLAFRSNVPTVNLSQSLFINLSKSRDSLYLEWILFCENDIIRMFDPSVNPYLWLDLWHSLFIANQIKYVWTHDVRYYHYFYFIFLNHWVEDKTNLNRFLNDFSSDFSQSSLLLRFAHKYYFKTITIEKKKEFQFSKVDAIHLAMP